VRRDVEPHRGNVLRVLGAVGLVCGFLSPVLLVPGVVGLPVSVVVLVLAYRDLARMRRGLLDPAGRAETETARVLADKGLLFSVAAVLVGGMLVLSLVAHSHL
jgi:hypothetical protein